MRSAYGAFSMVRALKRVSTAATLALFLAVYALARLGALVWCLVAILTYLALRHAGQHYRAKQARAAAAMKARMLDIRARTAEVKLALLAPDVAQAARDLAAGKIRPEDYETALDVAARTAQRPARQDVQAAREAARAALLAPPTAKELRALFQKD